jgi:hypothetical protein
MRIGNMFVQQQCIYGELHIFLAAPTCRLAVFVLGFVIEDCESTIRRMAINAVDTPVQRSRS